MKNPLNRIFGSNQEKNEEIQMIAVEKIKPNPYQPRQAFGEEEINELAASIEENGLLQPLLLRPFQKGYQIIAGERRLRALQKLEQEKAPCLIKSVSEQEMAQLALVENLQREDLHFLEEAMGYQRMLDSFNMTQEELADKIGRSQSAIANRLRLLKLPPALREKIIKAGLTERHARPLLKLKSPELQEQILQEVIRYKFSVGQTEKLIERTLAERKKGTNGLVVKVFDGTRLYVNTIRQTVKEMQNWGLDIEFEEREAEDSISFYITMSKRKETEG